MQATAFISGVCTYDTTIKLKLTSLAIRGDKSFITELNFQYSFVMTMFHMSGKKVAVEVVYYL